MPKISHIENLASRFEVIESTPVFQVAQHHAGPSLIALSTILTLAECSKSHVYNLIKRGNFPQPVLRCGPRFTRWAASDVYAWAANPQGWIDAHAKEGV
jgi:predicted DNA-binding transcriptional regulator AlpA